MGAVSQQLCHFSVLSLFSPCLIKDDGSILGKMGGDLVFCSHGGEEFYFSGLSFEEEIQVSEHFGPSFSNRA